MVDEGAVSTRTSNLDWKFGDEIIKHPGGEKLYLCYQCGCCTSTCPVGKLTETYRPRHILRMITLGFRRDVLLSESIWLCASCYTCQERCPQGVEVADIMLAARNIASKEGYAPKAFITQASTLLKKGRLAEATTMTERQRTMLGLPKVPTPPIDNVKKILQRTAFDKLVEKLKGE